MLKKHGWKIFLAVAAILMAGSFYWADMAGKKADEGVVLGENVKGNPDATVVLREYADFQCPACGQFYPVVKELMEDEGENIRLEFHHFPLVNIHPFAVPAAKAAEAAAQQGKFFEMHDKLFENQQQWSAAVAPQAFFNQYAEEIGLDMNLFKQHMRSTIIDGKIEQEFNEARERGHTGTPTFELNGERMEFNTLDEFRAQIDEAIYGPGTTTSATASTTEGTGTPSVSDVRFGF